MEIITLGGGDFFYEGLENANTNLKQKNYGLNYFGPLPNNFLVVCICTLIFHDIESPLPTNIIYKGAKKFFLILQLGSEKSSYFLVKFCIGGT